MGPGLCWTFFSLRILPLKARAYPMWEYSDRTNPIRESEEALPRSEVAVRVADVVVGDGVPVFDNHPRPLSLANPVQNVSLSTLFHSCPVWSTSFFTWRLHCFRACSGCTPICPCPRTRRRRRLPQPRPLGGRRRRRRRGRGRHGSTGPAELWEG
ncbi:hypothetical protein BAE44_0020235 [Dichanthelium oligosanthes]|uniref:Secreted protein n=1 Tax=Dichanthelium oligosanthes TaxID=888268 RepID=A0A1E5V0R4_9POAL|nr:hypothetical protein BAE44_0020235 [Dichanthelium oligosanthes]